MKEANPTLIIKEIVLLVLQIKYYTLGGPTGITFKDGQRQ